MSRNLNQERIVLAITILLFAFFALTLPGFLTVQNVLTLLRSVSVLGILGVGMAIVVVGRGIDLAIVAIMAVSVALTLDQSAHGVPLGLATLMGFGFAVGCGVVSGLLIAYAEVPAIFATLAMAAIIAGFGQSRLLSLSEIYVTPASEPLGWIGTGRVLGVPSPVLILAAVALAGFVLLRATKLGRFIYAIGDNPRAAHVTGVPVRPIIVLQFALSAITAFLAGLITATSVSSMNTRIVDSTLIYDIILVVVIGGIGLSGGKGGIRNVIVGTLLIGVLQNGMTILDTPYDEQSIIKSVILLFAIVADSIVNPRDEQTAQQGDI